MSETTKKWITWGETTKRIDAFLNEELRHYHVEDDTWFCCGKCPDCADDDRVGKCDCGLEERKERYKKFIHQEVIRGKIEILKIAKIPPDGYYSTHVKNLIADLERQIKKGEK